MEGFIMRFIMGLRGSIIISVIQWTKYYELYNFGMQGRVEERNEARISVLHIYVYNIKE